MKTKIWKVVKWGGDIATALIVLGLVMAMESDGMAAFINHLQTNLLTLNDVIFAGGWIGLRLVLSIPRGLAWWRRKSIEHEVAKKVAIERGVTEARQNTFAQN